MKKSILVISAVIITIILVGIVFNFNLADFSFDNYPCKMSPSNPEGPYYKIDAPFSSVLGEDDPGPRLFLTGKVLNRNCEPVSGAILDFWQTDSFGNYDNEGYNLRGKIITDDEGSYFLDTVYPAKYSEAGLTRPRHIHLKVWSPDDIPLTTQLYFENDPDLDIFSKKELTLKISEVSGVKKANFDFVINYNN